MRRTTRSRLPTPGRSCSAVEANHSPAGKGCRLVNKRRLRSAPVGGYDPAALRNSGGARADPGHRRAVTRHDPIGLTRPSRTRAHRAQAHWARNRYEFPYVVWTSPALRRPRRRAAIHCCHERTAGEPRTLVAFCKAAVETTYTLATASPGSGKRKGELIISNFAHCNGATLCPAPRRGIARARL